MKRKGFYYFTITFSLLVVWEIVSRHHPTFSFLCPPPTRIASTTLQSLPLLLFSSWRTLQGILGGVFLAIILSASLATIMLSYKSAKDLLQPLLVLLQCTPMFTLAPLIVLWVGWGINAVIIPTALTIFFPLTLTIYQGITSTPNELVEQFILLGTTKSQILIKLRLPYALPHIFSGLKIAIGSAGLAAIAGEWVASQTGLGILILESRRNYDMELAFAGLATLTFLTLMLFQITLLTEKLVFSLFRIKKIARQRKSFLKQYKTCILLVLFPLALLPLWKKTKPGPKQKNLTSLSLLLDWTPNPNHIPLYVGLAQGFFQDQGIDLRIQKNTDSSSVVPHILFEQVDMALYHAFGILKTSIKGMPIQIIGRLVDSSLQGFLYRAGDSITKFEDLNNKVLGVCLNNSRNLSALLETLRIRGVVPSEVKNVSADLISPILLKKIDFLYGAFYNIEGVKLATLGMPMKCFLSDTYGMPTGPQLLVCAKKGTKATEPEIALAFQKALEKSIVFSREHPKDAFDLYTKATAHTLKPIDSEYLQWQKTLPLLAQSQCPLDEELIVSLLQAIIERYPELLTQARTFSSKSIQGL
ncbi:ABC transporter substrate-binding protein [Candidatus Chlamydia sanziniae]|uniref:ABC transporter n=1 Tax=Candidatus Chlamydia sanziniae TaxID=1806891 RepID=A0A1A9HXN3_9CHLA|nr:ABC transporter substrate-binding protein [Candidatus Chlamydia sanziniae]ANH78804.1 putative ABC transporter [Candidatus Chlamydia sanziniae]